jgi:hypothetical protein
MLGLMSALPLKADIICFHSRRQNFSRMAPWRPRARRLVPSAPAYVGFVRANVPEYTITGVCHRSRGRPVIRCPILA